MKKIREIIQKEDGNILVLVALSIVVLLGFTAIAIDGGKLYSEKASLQKSLDAAVLAGVQELKEKDTSNAEIIANAKEVAKEIASQNGYDDIEVIVSLTENSVEAIKTKGVITPFANVLRSLVSSEGEDNADVFARAKALIGVPDLISAGLIPIALRYDDFTPGEEKSFTFPVKRNNQAEIDTHAAGNVGFVNLTGEKGGGTPNLEGHISDGYDGVVEKDAIIYTETGGAQGPFDALQARFDEDKERAENGKCIDVDTAFNECRRLIYVPLLESWGDPDEEEEGIEGKSTPVKIVGFAAFILTEVIIHPGNNPNNPNEIKGHFVRSITQEEMATEMAGAKDGSIYVIKLVE